MKLTSALLALAFSSQVPASGGNAQEGVPQILVVGIAIGLLATLATTRVISSMLFGVSAADPLTIAAASLMMIAVAAMAGFLPARRASRVDPMVALRYE